MKNAYFLSAGVPDPLRGPEYAKTADTVAITAAVSALVYVLLGRRPLVWGGQPAITPMIWVVAEDLEIGYGDWVRLYQSKFFRDEFPEDNRRFRNVRYTEAAADRETSLRVMREKMFSENKFAGAIFIGGMGGIVDEFELFRRLQPGAAVFPVASTGGAARIVASMTGQLDPALSEDRDYVGLFHRLLAISPRERRYDTPTQQPGAVGKRLWPLPKVANKKK